MKQKGFTLIELLVVVAIISLLASVVMASLNSARVKARDAKRIAEKREVVTAMNLFYNSNNGRWPDSGGTWRCFGAPSTETCFLANFSGLDSLVTDMAPYISSSPNNNASSGTYGYNRMIYHSSACVGCLQGIWPTSPAGAYLIWISENTMNSAKCSSTFFIKLDTYWYCYEYLGP